MPTEASKIKYGFSFQGWNAEHLVRTEKYAKQVEKLFNLATLDLAKLSGRLNIDKTKVFSFDSYPQAKAEAYKIVSKLTGGIQAVMLAGSEQEWLFANKKNDAFLESILKTSKLDKKALEKYQDHNLKALEAFQNRKVNGMSLSQRIWKYTRQYKSQIELGIDAGIGEGKPAVKMAQELKRNLLEPDKLFRRVRDKQGNLQLSKAAKAYHPGQGVYRSSYKNAKRLARSEVNMAYRSSDDLRWQQLDFVVGYDVKLSNNHTLNGVPFYDICDELAGRYPKNFRFVGWHPQCRCYKVPVLKDPDEIDADELGQLKAALNNTEYRPLASRKDVKDLPANFKAWAARNAKKVDGYKSTPYFVRDNFRYGKIRNGRKV